MLDNNVHTYSHIPRPEGFSLANLQIGTVEVERDKIRKGMGWEKRRKTSICPFLVSRSLPWK